MNKQHRELLAAVEAAGLTLEPVTGNVGLHMTDDADYMAAWYTAVENFNAANTGRYSINRSGLTFSSPLDKYHFLVSFYRERVNGGRQWVSGYLNVIRYILGKDVKYRDDCRMSLLMWEKQQLLRSGFLPSLYQESFYGE